MIVAPEDSSLRDDDREADALCFLGTRSSLTNTHDVAVERHSSPTSVHRIAAAPPLLILPDARAPFASRTADRACACGAPCGGFATRRGVPTSSEP